MKTLLKDFNTNLSQLKNDLSNDLEIEQNHFGDYLMIEENEGNEKYRVWLNHPENVAQGEAVAEIEYFGENNGYTWETISKIY